MAFEAEAARLLANIKADKAGGLDDNQILAARAGDIEQVMKAFPWAAIIGFLPVILKIIKALRNGDSLIDVIVENAEDIIRIITSFVPQDETDDDGPSVVA